MIKKLPFLVFMIFAMPAKALVVLQQVSVPTLVEYDDNVELTSNNAQSVWRYSTIPTYTISAVEGVNRWYSSIGLRLMRSSDKKLVVDREDPVVTVGWNKELEKGSFKLLGNYEENSIRTTELKRKGVVITDGDEINKLISAEWSRLLTERLNFTLAGKLESSKYTSGDLVDNRRQSLSSGLIYDVNEKASVFASAGYFKYISDDDNDPVNYQKYLGGLNYQISPALTVTAATGMNHFSSAGNYFVANAGIKYKLEKHSIDGFIERNADVAGGDGDVQLLKKLTLGYEYLLSERSKLGSAFSWQENEFKTANTTNQYMDLSGFYARDISDRWAMRFTLGFRRLKQENENAANGEIAGISFIYNTPQF